MVASLRFYEKRLGTFFLDDFWMIDPPFFISQDNLFDEAVSSQVASTESSSRCPKHTSSLQHSRCGLRRTWEKFMGHVTPTNLSK